MAESWEIPAINSLRFCSYWVCCFRAALRARCISLKTRHVWPNSSCAGTAKGYSKLPRCISAAALRSSPRGPRICCDRRRAMETPSQMMMTMASSNMASKTMASHVRSNLSASLKGDMNGVCPAAQTVVLPVRKGDVVFAPQEAGASVTESFRDDVKDCCRIRVWR